MNDAPQPEVPWPGSALQSQPAVFTVFGRELGSATDWDMILRPLSHLFGVARYHGLVAIQLEKPFVTFRKANRFKKDDQGEILFSYPRRKVFIVAVARGWRWSTVVFSLPDGTDRAFDVRRRDAERLAEALPGR